MGYYGFSASYSASRNPCKIIVWEKIQRSQNKWLNRIKSLILRNKFNLASLVIKLLPIIVFEPPPEVPGFIVTYSRIKLFFPISRKVFSPLNFRSWGCVPILANGNIFVLDPTDVLPSMCTFDTNSTLSANFTFGPI